MPAATSLRRIAVVSLLCIAGSGRASTAGETSPPASLPPIYVGKFQPVDNAPSGGGPLKAINARRRQRKAESKADELSSALVTALQKRKVAAQLLPEDAAARPRGGWMIQGVYYALDQNSKLVEVPLAQKDNGPNVEVSVSVTDLAADPNTPFAVLGTDAVMKGEGAPVGWNPYVVAAKFVFHQVQGQDSIAALADEVAQKIVDQGQDLRSHTPTAPAGAAAH